MLHNARQRDPACLVTPGLVFPVARRSAGVGSGNSRSPFHETMLVAFR
jgi:hypothetical protein